MAGESELAVPRTKFARLPVAALAGYLVGTFPTADVVARLAARANGDDSIDLRAAGTGNPGALNAAKMLGWKLGAVVLAGDIAKGALGALAGKQLAGDNGTYAGGAAAVVGHCAPVWAGFRGGKGIAASAGTALVCFPAYAAFDVALAAGLLALSRGQANAATYVTSAAFVGAAAYWWLKKKRNAWGPKPTAGLPLYALASSAVIAYRFATAPQASSAVPESTGTEPASGIETTELREVTP